MNILVYMAILCIFFKGYFDRTYMKSILAMLVVTILLDIAWLIVEAPVKSFSKIVLLAPIKSRHITCISKPSYVVYRVSMRALCLQ